MSSNDPIVQFPKGHRQLLGCFWTVYGVFRLIMALCMLVYSATATLMFGALLNRVADPFTLMGIFHFLYICMIALSVVCGLMGFVAGLAMLGGQPSARKLALIAAVLSLSDIPLGVTLGIYTLAELLPIRTMQLHSRSEQAA